MTGLVLRSTKGAPLTHDELDSNFTTASQLSKTHYKSFNFNGNIVPITGSARYYPPAACTLTSFSINLSTVNTVDSFIDIKKNGVSIFGSTKPKIPAGANVTTPVAINVAMTPSDYLTVDALTTGGAFLGVNLTILDN